jgi:hypothetical protein
MIEVFYQDGSDIFVGGYEGTCDDCGTRGLLADGYGSEQPLCLTCAKALYCPGFYWWSCFPGCLPDSDAFGPFETEAEALADAREGSE